ncbi:unnamed protein product [Cyprideis torosa]|uniref:proteasome endopeptidase complex n=1 Tax=Cyprideis torosa TaxID=163714 RepID=A0A7R8WS24_9CRUS|nr:unnamed protein product [Cyprideis torosa]CAG0904422.1 unnamed protein product [Cyprideis torosa]
MTTALAPDRDLINGFSFANCHRNAYLTSKGFPVPKAKSTGTTIVGVTYGGGTTPGVVLGSDTRATEGDIVADKTCIKIRQLQPNIYSAGAGTAADIDAVAKKMTANLELHRLNTGRVVPVVTASRMTKQFLFQYQGYIGSAFIIGGVDNGGPGLYEIYPHGSSARLPYCTLGSGSLAAMTVLESKWRPDLTSTEAEQLVREAIRSGIFNDLGSGSNVDICHITKEKSYFRRGFDIACEKGIRSKEYRFKSGSTAVLSEMRVPLVVEETKVTPIIEQMTGIPIRVKAGEEKEAMDVS